MWCEGLCVVFEYAWCYRSEGSGTLRNVGRAAWNPLLINMLLDSTAVRSTAQASSDVGWKLVSPLPEPLLNPPCHSNASPSVHLSSLPLSSLPLSSLPLSSLPLSSLPLSSSFRLPELLLALSQEVQEKEEAQAQRQRCTLEMSLWCMSRCAPTSATLFL